MENVSGGSYNLRFNSVNQAKISSSCESLIFYSLALAWLRCLNINLAAAGDSQVLFLRPLERNSHFFQI